MTKQRAHFLQNAIEQGNSSNLRCAATSVKTRPLSTTNTKQLR